jgi:hypothetical protein
MRKRLVQWFAASAVLACGAGSGFAQTSPRPGPTSPPPPNQPLAKPGADAVINPTTEECRNGWDPTLRWTKEQFEEFCAKMKAAK